eukprot:1372681-Amorphochlora_amoeboformis.AAC.1
MIPTHPKTKLPNPKYYKKTEWEGGKGEVLHLTYANIAPWVSAFFSLKTPTNSRKVKPEGGEGERLKIA